MAIYLKNSNVNGGNAVEILGTVKSFALKKSTRAEPIEGRTDGGSPLRYRISNGQRGGIENPKIIIQGNYSFDASNESNIMNEKLLKDFWRDVTGTNYLTIKLGYGDYEYRWSDWSGDNSSDDNIEVLIDSISIIPDSNTEQQHFYTYNITMTEVY
ncbi:MAG: hypothetical protein ACTSXD_08510 [Candidatus Heimdallarchaeaceae archaeon]